MSGEHKAVFLSYASQDAEAARRICAALRQAGVEVWFDQSELRGGDAWDAMIRKRIKECALFVPVISPNTNARPEGYFRLEWKLAVDRSHLMADDAPFLFPIAIGDVPDATARVPDKFREVQWTHLRLEETPAELARRVARLLHGKQGEGDRADGRPEAEGRGTKTGVRGGGTGERVGAARSEKRGLGKWWWLIFPIMGMAVPIVGILQQPGPRESSQAARGAPGDAAIDRAQGVLREVDVTRAELDVTHELLLKASATAPEAAEISAYLALVEWRYVDEFYDRSPARRASAGAHAARAFGLAPERPAVRLARAVTLRRLNPDAATRTEVAGLLEPLVAGLPGEPLVTMELGRLAVQERDFARADQWFEQLARIPGQSGAAAFEKANARLAAQDYAGAQRELAAAWQRGPATKFLLWRSYLETIWQGDITAARRTLARIPATGFVEDMPATARNFVEFCGRDFEAALAAVRAVPREFVESAAIVAPTALLRAQSLAQLGRKAAAESEWRAALAQIERQLPERPTDGYLLLAQAYALANLGESTRAEKAWATANELYGDRSHGWMNEYVASTVLSREAQLSRLEESVATGYRLATAAVLKLHPMYDAVRGDPRFGALLARAEAHPMLSPRAATAAQSRSETKSLAVLPFANLSAEKDNEYFADGLHEDVLTTLAKLRDLRVISRTSVLEYRGTTRKIADIARDLNVAYVLEGSVRRAGNRVRVVCQLIDARADQPVWTSDPFDSDLADPFAVQSRIAQAVARELKAVMTPEEKAEVEKRPTSNAAAYDLFLQARQRKYDTLADFDAGAQLLERAVTLDPAFALGWAQMAFLHARVYFLNFDHTPERLARATTAIQRAQALAPDDPAVLKLVGGYHYYGHRDYARARESYRRAGELLPNDAEIFFYLGVIARREHRWEECLDRIARALALDPGNIEFLTDYASTLQMVRRFEAARDMLRRIVARRPDDVDAHYQLALVDFTITGERRVFEEFLAGLAPAERDSPRMIHLRKGWTLLTGDFAEGIRLDRIQPFFPDGAPRHLQAFWAATLYEAAGDLAGARARLADIPEELRHRLTAEPNNAELWQRLGQIEALVGNQAEAERCIERAVALIPESRDALVGLDIARSRAFIWVRTGRRDEAIAEYARFLQVPGTSVPILRHGAFWAILRGDPKWEAVLADPKNHQPLY